MTALALVALAVVLFAPAYPLQWIGYFLLFLIAAGWFYRETISLNLIVRRKRTEINTYRNEVETIELVVINGSFLPIAYISIGDKTGNLYSPDEPSFIFSMKPKERRVIHYRIRGHQRGAYELGPIRVHSADPVGMFPLHRRIDSYAAVTIYPRILPASLIHTEGVPAGSERVPNPVYEDVTRYRAIRDYVPGDELRRINWKASARVGKLQSMEYLAAVDLPVVLLLNLTATNYEARYRWHAAERAIEVAATIAYEALRLGHRIGLETSGVIASEAGKPTRSSREAGADQVHSPAVPAGPGAQQATVILGMLARIGLNFAALDCVKELEEGHRVPYRAQIYYIGPTLTESQRAGLTRFRHTGRQIRCFYLQERTRERPPAVEFGEPARIIPEYGRWTVA